MQGCQVEAIVGLERSLAENRLRSLIQMATGSAKTFTAVSFAYRLMEHAGAKRVLFLVDRANLGPDGGDLHVPLHVPTGAEKREVVAAVFERVEEVPGSWWPTSVRVRTRRFGRANRDFNRRC